VHVAKDVMVQVAKRCMSSSTYIGVARVASCAVVQILLLCCVVRNVGARLSKGVQQTPTPFNKEFKVELTPTQFTPSVMSRSANAHLQMWRYSTFSKIYRPQESHIFIYINIFFQDLHATRAPKKQKKSTHSRRAS